MSWQSKADGVMAALTSAFGETATFTPIDDDIEGTSIDVPLIFNEMFTEIDANDGLQIISHKPNGGVRLLDFSESREPEIGDKITLRGSDYLIESVRDDGEAGTLLFLDKQT